MFKNTSKSIYACDAEYIHEVTGRDCSILTATQMDTVGRACENGALVWDWAHGEILEGEKNDAHNIKVITCREEVNMCEWTTEAECIGAYVGGAFDALND